MIFVHNMAANRSHKYQMNSELNETSFDCNIVTAIILQCIKSHNWAWIYYLRFPHLPFHFLSPSASCLPSPLRLFPTFHSPLTTGGLLLGGSASAPPCSRSAQTRADPTTERILLFSRPRRTFRGRRTNPLFIQWTINDNCDELSVSWMFRADAIYLITWQICL